MDVDNTTVDDKELLEELNTKFTDTLLPVTVFVAIETVVGFIGNLLTVCVFLFHYQPCNYRTFNICLGLIDFSCTLTTMPGEIVTQRFWYNYPYPVVCKTKDFFNIFTVSAETLVLLIIAIDRYRKICCPLKWQISPTIAVVLCIAMLLLAAVIASPVSVFWGIRSYQKVYKNTTITVTLCEKDEAYENTDYPFGYEAMVGGLIFTILVPMLILNVAVARRLFSRKKLGTPGKKKITQTISTISASEISLSCLDSEINDKRRQIGDASGEIDNKQNDKPGRESETERDEGNATISTMGSIHSKSSRKKKVNPATAGSKSSRVRRKALIMFILTATFMCTTVLYFTMISILGSAGNIVNSLSDGGKAGFFFFLRFYFIQHIINPILYAILDPNVQKGLKLLFLRLLCRKE
ncbi:hypothetical protein ACF0H5_024025 [Mactra antiquata]